MYLPPPPGSASSQEDYYDYLYMQQQQPFHLQHHDDYYDYMYMQQQSPQPQFHLPQHPQDDSYQYYPRQPALVYGGKRHFGKAKPLHRSAFNLSSTSTLAAAAAAAQPQAYVSNHVQAQLQQQQHPAHEAFASTTQIPQRPAHNRQHLQQQQQQHIRARKNNKTSNAVMNAGGVRRLATASSNMCQQQAIGQQMLVLPQYQRGLAYSDDERREHRLAGLLPPARQDQQLQIQGVMNYIDKCQDELSKYVYLRELKDFNERLFYAALTKNVERLMPIVYTPTVGLACQRFSDIYMRPRGMFITTRDLGQVSSLLANWHERDVRVIVVTDGERILGLGDLGANGMGICIGKLSLYTALAGIPPQNVLPVCIDVGTQNAHNLRDPLYIGLRQERVRGAQYETLLDEFMRAVVQRWGRSCLIQFEDFANATAFKLLQRYHQSYCTFNDDIQGTASVCLSGLLTASKLVNKRLSDCSFLFYGAGEANLGTAQLLIMAMRDEEGMSERDARKRIWLVDSKGLVCEERTDLSEHKRQFAQSAPPMRELLEIIEHTKPTAIIGASAQGGAFSEQVCKLMAQINDRPIIFALSNPTSKAECTARDAYEWTRGKCVFASGSPFEPVQYDGKTYVTGQGNNAYIFPGVGLAAIAAHVHTIPEDTFLVAARALSEQVTPADIELGLVYPKLGKIREVTLRVACRVLEHFYAERLATYRPEPNDKLQFLRSIQYDYRYEAEPLQSARPSSSTSTLSHSSLGTSS